MKGLPAPSFLYLRLAGQIKHHRSMPKPRRFVIANLHNFCDISEWQIVIRGRSRSLWLGLCLLLLINGLLCSLNALTLHFPCVEVGKPFAVPFATFRVKRNFDLLADIRTLVHLVAEKLHTHFLRGIALEFRLRTPFSERLCPICLCRLPNLRRQLFFLVVPYIC